MPKSRLAPEAVKVEIEPIRRARRRELSRRAWSRLGRTELIVASPLILLVVLVAIALTVYPPLYALYGTGVPGLVNEAGDKGPAPMDERIEAWAIWIPWMAILGFIVWRQVRARLSTPYLAVDPRGVWPVFGGRIEKGLEWPQIAAVLIEDAKVELFPVDAIKDSGQPTVLDFFVVNAPPPAPRLRGKRYVIELPEGEPGALREAVKRFGPGKLL
ncbi:hypothetical protein [Actinomadura rudentiformis]|uniref:Uncharacterized protein n=1 Tax=Actinomadura rudentiformis TaxID=359158 RepID=A0A6H9Z038_9ACTN|nr:hypothetical protein [Actinomadura rudentiformis]KAB2348509.1 hypothetical protein F8566_17150 [Actinomadura rudentiformis]